VQTVYDWLTVTLFAGLVVLFLQRSSLPEPPDRLRDYLIAAVGCLVANYLGNEEMHVVAIPALVATLAFIYYVLHPFRHNGSI
jgi:hypothetical protein